MLDRKRLADSLERSIAVQGIHIRRMDAIVALVIKLYGEEPLILEQARTQERERQQVKTHLCGYEQGVALGELIGWERGLEQGRKEHWGWFTEEQHAG